MHTIYIIVLWLASCVLAMDFGTVSFPGYRLNPARPLADSVRGEFGVAYAQVPEADVHVASAAGAFGLGMSQVAFASSYTQMDSLYRQVYSEIDISLVSPWLVGGVGYGISVDWIAEGDFSGECWTVNHYKAGLAVVKSPLSLSGMATFVNHGSFYDVDYVASFRFDGGRFGAFVEYDGVSVDVGNYLKFAHLSVFSAYRFPEFAVAVSLVFTVGDWSLSGAYGKAYPIWDWFHFTASRVIRKKTIL